MSSSTPRTEKAKFVEVFEKAGWNASIWDTHFESGAKLPYPGHAQRLTASHNLVVEYHGTEHYIALYVADRQTFRYEKFRLYYPGTVDDLLQLIVKNQQQLELGVKKLLSVFAPLCTSIHPEGDDGKSGAILQLGVPYFTYQQTNTSNNSVSATATQTVTQQTTHQQDDENEEDQIETEDDQDAEDEEQESNSENTNEHNHQSSDLDFGEIEYIEGAKELIAHITAKDFANAILAADRILEQGFGYDLAKPIRVITQQADPLLFATTEPEIDPESCRACWEEMRGEFPNHSEEGLWCLLRASCVGDPATAPGVYVFIWMEFLKTLVALSGMEKYPRVLQKLKSRVDMVTVSNLTPQDCKGFAEVYGWIGDQDKCIETLQCYMNMEKSTQIDRFSENHGWVNWMGNAKFLELQALNQSKQQAATHKLVAKKAMKPALKEPTKKSAQTVFNEAFALIESGSASNVIQKLDELVETDTPDQSMVESLAAFFDSTKIELFRDTPIDRDLDSVGGGWDGFAGSLKGAPAAKAALRSLVAVTQESAQDLYSAWAAAISAGKAAQARAEADFLREESLKFVDKFPPIHPYSIAEAALLLIAIDEEEKALRMLTNLLEHKPFDPSYLRTQEYWAKVKGKPQFEELIDQCVERCQQASKNPKKSQ